MIPFPWQRESAVQCLVTCQEDSAAPHNQTSLLAVLPFRLALVVSILVSLPLPARAGCYIQYSAELHQAFQRSGQYLADRAGNFATKEECESYKSRTLTYDKGFQDSLCVCDGAGGGGFSLPGAGGGSLKQQVTTAMMQGFLNNLFSDGNPGPQGAKNGPAAPSSVINPKYVQAVEKLASLRLPNERAKEMLNEALRSQAQGSRLYDPGDLAMAQLRTSQCLADQALRTASPARAEETSWLLQQSSEAMNGNYVEAYPGQCAQPKVPDPGEPERVPEETPTEKIRLLLDKVETVKVEREVALKQLDKAKTEVTRWKEVKARLETEAAQAPEAQRKEKSDALDEATRMLLAAEQNLDSAEKNDAATDADLRGAEQAVQESARAATPVPGEVP
jgi:hypothetical protein